MNADSIHCSRGDRSLRCLYSDKDPGVYAVIRPVLNRVIIGIIKRAIVVTHLSCVEIDKEVEDYEVVAFSIFHALNSYLIFKDNEWERLRYVGYCPSIVSSSCEMLREVARWQKLSEDAEKKTKQADRAHRKYNRIMTEKMRERADMKRKRAMRAIFIEGQSGERILRYAAEIAHRAAHGNMEVMGDLLQPAVDWRKRYNDIESRRKEAMYEELALQAEEISSAIEKMEVPSERG